MKDKLANALLRKADKHPGTWFRVPQHFTHNDVWSIIDRTIYSVNTLSGGTYVIKHNGEEFGWKDEEGQYDPTDDL